MHLEIPSFPDYLRENAAIKLCHYKNQESIYQQGQVVSDVSIIQQGYVKLQRLTHQGRQVTLSLLGAQAIFGALESPLRNTQEFSSAQLDVTLYKMSWASFEHLLKNDSQFSRFVVYSLSRQQERLQHRLFFMMHRKVEARLAAVLCDLATHASERCVHGGAIDLAVTQQDIADLVGASRQVVSTLLNRWRDQDIVHYWQDFICLLNLAELKILAEQ